MKGELATECNNLVFKKSRQDLDFDATCLVADVTAKYCSDKDAVQIRVGISGLPKISVMLTQATCPRSRTTSGRRILQEANTTYVT